MSLILQFSQLKYIMNYHFTFGSPIKTENDVKEPEFLNESLKGACNLGNSFDNQQTNSHSKARKKFMKIYSNTSQDPNHRRITLSSEHNQAIVDQKQKSNRSKLCKCFDGNKNQQIVDFGYTSKLRQVSPDPRPKKVGKFDTPVNELVELEELQNSHQIHYLHPPLSFKK